MESLYEKLLSFSSTATPSVNGVLYAVSIVVYIICVSWSGTAIAMKR